jgi:flagellar biosynthesis protein FlhF
VKVKSFYGNSIKEALSKARAELGADATIVASRQLRPEEGRGAGCEIVCGVPGVEAPVETVAPAEPARPKARVRDGGVARMRKGLEAVRTIIAGPQVVECGSDEVASTLAAMGLSSDLAAEITAGVRQRQRKAGTGPGNTVATLREELSARLAVAAELGRVRSPRSVVALVGAPGSGKTTTIVKLAVRYGLMCRRQVHIVTAAGSRVGGADAMRIYAAAMGVPCDVVETADALDRVLNSLEGNRLILIDTPGFTVAEGASAEPLATMLSGHSEADVHLVLNAALAPKALAATAARFRRFLPSKIIASHADTADSLLPVAALALDIERPISFVSTGQAIPEDLSEATTELLLGSLVETEREAGRAAGAA